MANKTAKTTPSATQGQPLAESDREVLDRVSEALKKAHPDRIGMFIAATLIYGSFRIIGIGVPATGAWYMGPNGSALVNHGVTPESNFAGVRILLERIYE